MPDSKRDPKPSKPSRRAFNKVAYTQYRPVVERIIAYFEAMPDSEDEGDELSLTTSAEAVGEED